MTREDDKSLSLRERSDFANEEENAMLKMQVFME